jgi:hypothetical protein
LALDLIKLVPQQNSHQASQSYAEERRGMVDWVMKFEDFVNTQQKMQIMQG